MNKNTKMIEEQLRRLKEDRVDDDYPQEERERAYKEFFGQSWKDIIDLWMVENLTPEEAVDKLGDENMLDYCDYCKTYFLVDVSPGGVYYCPYCGHYGTDSERDYEAERQAWLEHEWEVKNDR